MNLKTKIKNDFWQINYVIPFTAKYLQEGKISYIKKALPVIAKTRVVKNKKSTNEKTKRDIASDIKALMEKIELHISQDPVFFYYLDEYKTIAVKGQIISNFTLDYERLITGAFDAYADKAIAVGSSYGKRASEVKRAVHILANNISQLIDKEYPEGENKKRILREFSDLLEKPAKHFHEGLQRILFFNQYLWQTRHKLNGLGRLNKILGNLYRQDLEEGVITEKSAYSLILDFLRVLHKWYEYKSAALLGDIGQIIILGGLEKDGSYFCNDLTYMFIKAQAEVEQPDPKVLLRVSEKMPEKLLKSAVSALMSRTGSPLFSNDDVIIPKLQQFGFAENDAYAYCVSACWEPYIPGKSLDQNNVFSFDFFKPLNKCLNRIIEKSGGERISPSFEDLLIEYGTDLKEAWNECGKNLDVLSWAIDPFVSMLTDGCTESGKDISEGGALYSNYGVTTIGMGSAVDTLLNIKKLVYDERKYTLAELNKCRLSNFKEAKETYYLLQKMEKHYAHDDPDAIELTNHIISISNQAVSGYINPLGGKIKFGLSSPDYMKGASNVPADLAGRKKGTAYTIHISNADASYTEVVNFAGNLNYNGHAFNGNVVDYFLSPSLIEQNTGKFVMFMKGAIKSGFFQMQMNIMDSKTLIDAKEYPEKYPGLIVRVWGFSSYFNDLPEEYKDLLIQRALDAEKIGI